MIAAGLDVGTRRSKAVLLDRGAVVGACEAETGADMAGAALRALRAAGAEPGDVDYLLATGAGRRQVAFRHGQATEITCLGRALGALAPGAERLLDVGAQLARAIRADPSGRVVAFRLSDRCAAGGGRFLERAARILGLAQAAAATAAAGVDRPTPLRAVCAVLGESEIVSLVSQGAAVDEILAAVAWLVGARSAELVPAIGGGGPVVLVGGPAEAPAVQRAVEARLGAPVVVPERPSLATALGAARLAAERLRVMRRAMLAPAPGSDARGVPPGAASA